MSGISIRTSNFGPSAANADGTSHDGRSQTKFAELAYDVVNQASIDSFPARDAPGWINGAEPTHEKSGFRAYDINEKFISERDTMMHTISRPSDPRRPDITVNEADLSNLECLLSIHATHRSWRSVEFLVRELMRATIVDGSEIAPDVVTMGSRVEYLEEGRGPSQVATLSYPGQRESIGDAISVLAPIGAALLGLAAGQSISYAGPDGRPITITIIRVMYQPEANHRMRSKQTPGPMSASPLAAAGPIDRSSEHRLKRGGADEEVAGSIQLR